MTKTSNPVVAYEAKLQRDSKTPEFAFDEAVLERPKWTNADRKEGKEEKEEKV